MTIDVESCYYTQLDTDAGRADLRKRALRVAVSSELQGRGGYRCANIGECAVHLLSRHVQHKIEPDFKPPIQQACPIARQEHLRRA